MYNVFIVYSALKASYPKSCAKLKHFDEMDVFSCYTYFVICIQRQKTYNFNTNIRKYYLILHPHYYQRPYIINKVYQSKQKKR
jgi:hypothetical protein